MLNHCLAAALIAVTCAACSNQPDFDLVVSGGMLIDGTGAEARRADVGIKGDRITAIGNLGSRTTSAAIDASGKIVAPGFINLLSRSGVALLADGLAESQLRQGITSDILGAQSPAFWTQTTADEPALRRHGLTLDWSGLNGYFDKLEARGAAINVGTLIPLSSATGTTTIDEDLRDGAFGVIDDRGVTPADLNAVGAVVARHDGVLVVPAENPIVSSDDALAATATASRRLLVSDVVSASASTTTADLVERMVRLNQRGTEIYAAAIPAGRPEEAISIRDALRYGGVMVAADTTAAFPGLLGPLVRDAHVMELREGVRRSTSLPASVLRLQERGIIRERWFADVVVFDERAIADRPVGGTPNDHPAGIDYVIVNGVVAVAPKGLTGARPGYPLLRRAANGT